MAFPRDPSARLSGYYGDPRTQIHFQSGMIGILYVSYLEGKHVEEFGHAD